MGGARAGRRMGSRMATIAVGSVTSARILRRPPQGQASTSSRKTRRRVFVKLDGAARRLAREDSIERDHVQVHEASERGVESLHEADGTRLASLDAERLRLLLLPPRDLLDEEAVLRRQRVGSKREH